MAGWTIEESEGFQRMAPLVGVINDLDHWSAAEKRSLATLMKAKGGRYERAYITKLKKHRRLRESLIKYARRVTRSWT